VPHLGGSRGEHFGRGVDKVDNHLLVRLPLLIPRASNQQHAKNAAPQQPAGSNYFSEHCSNRRGKEGGKSREEPVRTWTVSSSSSLSSRKMPSGSRSMAPASERGVRLLELEGSRNSLGFKTEQRDEGRVGRDYWLRLLCLLEEGGSETQLGLRRGPEAADMAHGPTHTRSGRPGQARGRRGTRLDGGMALGGTRTTTARHATFMVVWRSAGMSSSAGSRSTGRH